MDDATQSTGGSPVIPLSLKLVPGGSSLTFTQRDVLVGRHSDADVRLHLPDVSRRHCRLRFHDGNWHVYDLQSTNGVYINDERVGQAELQDADLIRIGSYTFEVHMAVEEAPAPSHAHTMHTWRDVAGVPPPMERLRRKAS